MPTPAQPPAPPTADQLAKYSSLFNKSSAFKLMGFRVQFPDLETVELVVDPVLPFHRGGMGTDAVNGGILASVFDLVIGCTPALLNPNRQTATVHLSMNFMRAVRGDKFVARATIERAGDVLLFAHADILDANGQVCANCQGMCRLTDRPWPFGDIEAMN